MSEDLKTPILRLYHKVRRDNYDLHHIVPLKIKQIWFTGDFRTESFLLIAEDWQARINFNRTSAIPKWISTEIENEVFAARDMVALRVSGNEELFV